MLLHETMSNAQQMAYLVGISHAEYVQEVKAGVETGTFDEWLTFIGQIAVQICSSREGQDG